MNAPFHSHVRHRIRHQYFDAIIGTTFRIGLAVLLTLTGSAAYSQDTFDGPDDLAKSGDPQKIIQSIERYRAMPADDVEVGWRLMRAYYNLSDELYDANRKKERKEACKLGYKLAKELYAEHSNRVEVAFYYAMNLACDMQLGFWNRFTYPFRRDNVIRALEQAREIDASFNEAGPDRGLGLGYLVVPGYRKPALALEHLRSAYKIAPDRGGNRAWLAKALIDNDQIDEAWQHIDFMRACDYTVSSKHWQQIYERRIEELARELPARTTPEQHDCSSSTQ